MRVVFIHGACVKDGWWWWHRAGADLQRRGFASVATALPSCGEGNAQAGLDAPGLDDDVAAVRAVLLAGTEPTVVVARSYGGIVAAEALAGLDTVAHLVLISSYLPEIGESLSSFAASEPAPFLEADPAAGTFGVRPELLADTFLQDCADIAPAAATHLAQQSLSVTQQPVRAAAWHRTTTTCVVCTRDRGTPVEAQRECARRADSVVELKTGHHPFLSQPSAVADLLAGLA